MYLLYFPVNAAYAFVFGSTIEDANLCNLHGFPMFYETKGEAIEAARHRGLVVDLKTNCVTIEATASTYTIKRDGVAVVSGLSNDIAVLDWFHKHTNQSQDWMCKHEGYSVDAVPTEQAVR